MRSVIVIFLDGVGLGKADEASNPFFFREFDFARKLFGELPSLENPFLRNGDGVCVFPSDATLETEGLPQSGTGQTSILCGVNAAKITGGHFGPFPHSSLNETIKKKNVYSELRRKGFSGTFANAYPPKFFEYLKKGRSRMAATTKAALGAGLKLRDIKDLRDGVALSHEIDNWRWKNKLGLPVGTVSPKNAALNLLRLSENYDFVFFEYFFTDRWGHGRNLDFYAHGIETLNEFLTEVIANLKSGSALLVCSDHGNFEDLSVKTHTRNPAFTLAAGEQSEMFAREIKTLADIQRAVIKFLL